MTARDDSLLAFAIEKPLHYFWGLVADLVITIATFFCGPLAVLSVLVFGNTRTLDRIAVFWSKLIVRVCGVQLEVVGLEHLKPGKSYVLISNHASLFDIPATVAAIPRTLRFVAKHELLKVPALGPALGRSDHIVINRQDPHSAIRTINNAATRSADGICILFYAEGTRSDDGHIGEFKKGATSLALRAGLPVVPVSISGTRKLLPKDAAVVRPGGTVRIVLGKPINTARLPEDSRDELNQRVRAAVIAGCTENL